MKFFDLNKLFRKKVPETPAPIVPPRRPLREFVYLDEISLRSLLSSQTGEVTDSTSEAITDAMMNQASGGGGLKSPVANLEMNALFQTTNSNTLQTSRKASAQSWFREFHALGGLKLIRPMRTVQAALDVAALKANENRSVVAAEADLTRGSLVEFRVRLKADPVFHLGTLMSEFGAMAQDHPDLLADGMTLGALHETLLVNKVLNRLLVGLVPINAEAVDHRVVHIDGVEYVVHSGALTDLDLPSRPLQLVGVTEQSAYWKDLRRVLFSEEEFTVMCRIARAGLQRTWTPVKLVDLFSALAPDLAETINTAGRAPFLSKGHAPEPEPVETRLVEALRAYAKALVLRSNETLTRTHKAEIERRIQAVGDRMASVTAQRSAFAAVSDKLSDVLGVTFDPNLEIECREHARIVTGLPLFPALEPKPTQTAVVAPLPASDARLLDVEVIAIYW